VDVAVKADQTSSLSAPADKPLQLVVGALSVAEGVAPNIVVVKDVTQVELVLAVAN
jgi:hypothetical protein